MKFDFSKISLAAVVSLTLSSTPTWASTLIKVVEAGEAGQAMTLKLEPNAVKTGETIFSVKNDAVSEEHEMIVIKLKSVDQKIPMMKGKDRIDEAKLKSMGEAGDLKPGATGELKANLKPGTYLVLCNIKGHYSVEWKQGWS